MPRHSEDVFPRCISCGQALGPNTSVTVRTDSEWVLRKLQWWLGRLRCQRCQETQGD